MSNADFSHNYNPFSLTCLLTLPRSQSLCPEGPCSASDAQRTQQAFFTCDNVYFGLKEIRNQRQAKYNPSVSLVKASPGPGQPSLPHPPREHQRDSEEEMFDFAEDGTICPLWAPPAASPSDLEGLEESRAGKGLENWKLKKDFGSIAINLHK